MYRRGLDVSGMNVDAEVSMSETLNEVIRTRINDVLRKGMTKIRRSNRGLAKTESRLKTDRVKLLRQNTTTFQRNLRLPPQAISHVKNPRKPEAENRNLAENVEVRIRGIKLFTELISTG